MTAVDRRWQMILDYSGDEPAFSQGTVFNFRERARRHGFLQVLLDHTVELARETGGFSHKRLRVLLDSSPLLGAGRVEDSFNLIGRAVGQLVKVAAKEVGRKPADLADELGLTVVSAKSVKAALDVDWRLPDARNEALNALLGQFEVLRSWLTQQFGKEQVAGPPIGEALATVERLIEQDTEPDPDSPSGGARIRQGGTNRRISIADPEMRHGRKSKTRVFSGYKRHVSVDADLAPLIVGVHLEPGNIREYEGAQPLLEDAERQGFAVTEAHFDRGYLVSEAIHERRGRGLRIVSKPPTPPRTGDRLNKSDFDIDVALGLVTCPSGRTEAIRKHRKQPVAIFPAEKCGQCQLLSRCQTGKRDRVVTIHPREELYQQMAKDLSTPEGRERRRARVAVEHALARLGGVQGRRARYFGIAKNQFHATASAVVANCFVVNGLLEAA